MRDSLCLQVLDNIQSQISSRSSDLPEMLTFATAIAHHSTLISCITSTLADRAASETAVESGAARVRSLQRLAVVDGWCAGPAAHPARGTAAPDGGSPQPPTLSRADRPARSARHQSWRQRRPMARTAAPPGCDSADPSVTGHTPRRPGAPQRRARTAPDFPSESAAGRHCPAGPHDAWRPAAEGGQRPSSTPRKNRE